jgi:DNA polymerase
MNDLCSDLFADDLQQIHLASPTDLAGFRRAARRLLASGVAPDQVLWLSTGAVTALDAPESGGAPAVHVAPDFLALCETVILHSDAGRFELLYRLLWRMAREPGLKHDPLDADRLKAQHLAQAVRRDMHKMKAFVRFRTVADETFRTRPTGGPLHVAWFEPEHHIVEAIAPFFARRFTQMRWAILTPERCLAWDGARMRLSPGAEKSDAPPPDAGEALWLTYYQNIFNPARLKLKMMQKEMPRRYWHNLPEAQLISALAASAGQRQQTMVSQAPSTPSRRIPAFRRAADSQQALQI